MNDRQRDEFFRKWFPKRSRQVTEIRDFMTRHPHIADVCRTPIVASLVASLAERRFDLPQTRTEVYTRRFDLLLQSWAIVKDIAPRSLLPLEDKKHLLANLALHLHKRHERQFTQRAFEELWAQRYAASFRQISSSEVFDELHIANGVLEHEGGTMYSLGHLSYQEYLAAMAVLYDQSMSTMLDNVGDPWWRQVIVFYVGLTKDATKVISRLMTQHGMTADSPLIRELSAEARLTRPDVIDFVNAIRGE